MKKILVVLAFVAASLSVNASYLYWQVNSTDTASLTTGYTNYQYDLYAGSTKIATAEAGNMQAIDVSAYNDATVFYIEIMGYNDSYVNATGVGHSEYATYATLSTKSNITTDLVSVPVAWTGGTFAAPEPTSGLLMVLGLAMLGLKRRKV